MWSTLYAFNIRLVSVWIKLLVGFFWGSESLKKQQTYRIADVRTFNESLADQYSRLDDIKSLWVFHQALETLHELLVHAHVCGEHGFEQELSECRRSCGRR